MKNKLVSSSPRIAELHRKKNKVLKRKIAFSVIFFICIIVGLGLLSRASSLNIKEVNISGNIVVDNSEIKNIVESKILGHYFWIFPKANFALYPKNKIKKELMKKFNRLKDISFNLQSTSILTVNVSEYEGKYLWCGEQIPAVEFIKSKCYFLDDTGYIFDEAPFFSGGVYFKFYGEPSHIGSFYLKNHWANIILLKKTLESMRLKPTNFWLDENKDGNISLSSEPMKGPRIIFNLDTDYQKMAENLQSALDTDPLRTDYKYKFDSLDYINLSFGNKVYYKFK